MAGTPGRPVPPASCQSAEAAPTMDDDAKLRAHLATVTNRLDSHLGEPRWMQHRPPLDELILTVLSQRTSDTNSERAFASLRERFPSWRDVAEAPVAAVADAIRCGGLAALKAPRIQRILRDIASTTGGYSLDWLLSIPQSEARQWLLTLPGVGPKTAACVLLFSLGQPAMPVDTHVHRVSRRLGLIDETLSAERAHDALEALIGPDRDAMYALHLNLIRHGRTLCRARAPVCHRCFLTDICPSVCADRMHPVSGTIRPERRAPVR
jgi:endonuclease-3